MTRRFPASAICGAMFLCSCQTHPVSSTDPAVDPPTGTVKMTVHLGPVGTVSARGARMEPTSLHLRWTSDRGDLKVDTIRGIRSGGEVSRTYGLFADRTWSVEAIGFDQRDSILHRGRRKVLVVAGKSTEASLALDARFSTMTFQVKGDPTFRRFELLVDGSTRGSTDFPKSTTANDTLVVERDYLDVDRGGIGHRFHLAILGDRGDKDTTLFMLDTDLVLVSGQNQSLRLTLHPTNPDLAKGQVSLHVQLGVVGQLTALVVVPVQPQRCAQWQDSSRTIWNQDIVYGLLCDTRDGRSYRTVQMGNQVWMAQNLQYRGPSGDLGSCSMNADSNCTFSGRMYTWLQAMALPETYLTSHWPGDEQSQQGICPDGWRIPSTRDWQTLLAWVNVVAPHSAEEALRSIDGFADNDHHPMVGTDQFGFHALPNRKNESYLDWWTSTNSSDPDYDHMGDVVRLTTYGRLTKEFPSNLRCIQR